MRTVGRVDDEVEVLVVALVLVELPLHDLLARRQLLRSAAQRAASRRTWEAAARPAGRMRRTLSCCCSASISASLRWRVLISSCACRMVGHDRRIKVKETSILVRNGCNAFKRLRLCVRARVGARLLLRTAALRVVLLQELVKADEGLLQLEVLEAQPVLASLEHLAVTGFGRQVGSTVSERARKRRGSVC